jgi:tetratricopeptide (TPR) repeat protein
MTSDVGDQVTELISLAGTLFESGNLEASEAILGSLNIVAPSNVEVLKRLGIIYATKGQYTQATELLVQASALNDRDPLVQNLLSVCYFKTNDDQSALESADRAIALRKNFGEAHNNRGNALNRLGRRKDALNAFERSLALMPGDPEIYVNIGNVQRDLEQAEASLENLDRAIAIDPQIVDAHYNRGNALQDLGRHAEAIESYDRALALDADHVDSHWNRSLCNLLIGNFDAGWREYEWRWRRASAESAPRGFPCPLWLGREDLAGKSILLHCEQGLGDSIQFIRYAPAVARLGAAVIVEAFEPLADLFGSVEGVAQVVPRGAPSPPVDFHCPLMSLPLALGGGEALSPAPPYLRSIETRRKWRGELRETGALNVGVVFSGSKTHRADQSRSIPAAAIFEALPVGPAYHILQKELREADSEIVNSRKDVRYFADEIGGFEDTAALCEAMDVVISVDTSVAHLAGAMGRPTWILLPFDPDWRWMLDKETTHWYASAKLYRQAVRGDWSVPLGRIAADLAAMARGPA